MIHFSRISYNLIVIALVRRDRTGYYKPRVENRIPV